MKTTILTLTAVLVLSAASPAQGQTTHPCGDCNGDGAVSITDALVAAQTGSGIYTNLCHDCPCSCNVYNPTGNCASADGIDILDAFFIALHTLGAPVTLSCAP